MFSSSQLGSIQTIADPAYKQAPAIIDDSIASLAWHQPDTSSGLETLGLVSSSWDSKVRFFTINPPTSSEIPVRDIAEPYLVNTEFPVISLSVNQSTMQVLGGAVDGSIYLIDPVSARTVGKHNDAVKGVYFLDNGNVFCTVSYDKTLKIWDLRMPNVHSTYNLGGKVLCLDMLGSFLAAGLNDGRLLMCDLIGIHRITNFRDFTVESPLGNDSALSAVSISKENVIGVGSCDGRSNLSSFAKRSNGAYGLTNIVTFKAHKIDPGQDGNTSDLKILYPIHAVGLYPQNKNTYFTAGGDGKIVLWDIPARNKITTFSCHPAPITAAKLSPDGKYLAYAFGYDWGKGIEGAKSMISKLHVHTTQSTELANV